MRIRRAASIPFSTGKSDVQQNQIWSKRSGLLDGVEPIRGFTDHLPSRARLKRRFDVATPGLVVIDHENTVDQCCSRLPSRAR